MTDYSHVSAQRLQRFFRPRSIALVGATDNSRWSLYTFENLRNFAFAGPIYLVNPHRQLVHGQPAYRTLADLPEVVDLAFIMVATARVLQVVQEAAALGTAHFVILTSGFSEMGAEGARLEHELLAFARERELILLGPNGNGFINITDQITPYGLPIARPLKSGPVGVVLQSGALASAVLAFAQGHAIGLSLLVAMGNESMISVTDVVEYLVNDAQTRAIALFLESVRHPGELRRVAELAHAHGKVLVALKIGRSEAGSRAALAHTGALVGNDAVNDAAFRQLGILRVSSLEDLLTTAGLAAYYGPLPGRRMGVVTASGGACDIISDLAEEMGIALPAFAPQTVQRLQALLPAFSTCQNPLDVTGYVVVEPLLQMRALEIVAADPQIDFVLNLTSLGGGRGEPAPGVLQTMLLQYETLAQLVHSAPHPVILSTTTCTDLSIASYSVVEHNGLHVTAGLEHGMRALGRVLRWSPRPAPQVEPESQFPVRSPLLPSAPTGAWSEVQARALLQQAGIPFVPGQLVTSAAEAVQAARALGFPAVLKIQSPALPHKSDVGGVVLNLVDEHAVHAAYSALLACVQAGQPGIEIEGVLVCPQRQAGIELLVGIVRDSLWGPVLTLGLGGIWTEVLQDTALRLLPVTPDEIMAMLTELRGAPLLQGARGGAGVDLPALCAVIARIAALALALGPRLSALEINPLLVSAQRIEALDVLIHW